MPDISHVSAGFQQGTNATTITTTTQQDVVNGNVIKQRRIDCTSLQLVHWPPQTKLPTSIFRIDI
jgi:hypothetical protein